MNVDVNVAGEVELFLSCMDLMSAGGDKKEMMNCKVGAFDMVYCSVGPWDVIFDNDDDDDEMSKL